MQLRVKAMYELPQKKEELWNKYENAIIIEDMDEYKNFDGNTVIRGCNVSLMLDDEKVDYFISGTDEGNIDEDIMSCSAPIAEAILNKNIGDKILFNGFYIEILNVWI
jgi:transcription elongation GreA/GreB family factor